MGTQVKVLAVVAGFGLAYLLLRPFKTPPAPASASQGSQGQKYLHFLADGTPITLEAGEAPPVDNTVYTDIEATPQNVGGEVDGVIYIDNIVGAWRKANNLV